MKPLNCVDSPCKRRAGRCLGAWLILSLLTAAGAAVADYPLTMIQLNHRFPDDLIPILTPLVGPEGSLVGANNTLFVRASPARLAELRRALAALDRPQRSLLIQVRQSGSRNTSGAGVGVRVGRTWAGGGQLDAGAGAGNQTQDRDLAQEVRTLDGRAAFIAVGQDQPLGYRELRVGPGGTMMREGRAYHQSQSGFYVVPRVRGDQVVLEITTRADTPGARGTIETNDVEARVQGRLGDWIPVAANTETQAVQGAGTLYYGQGQRSSQGQVELRVLPLD